MLQSVRLELPCSMQKSLRTLWWQRGATGCLLIGTGLSVTLDALAQRLGEAGWWVWAGEGTVGLVVFMAGMAFFGDAVRYRVHMDRESKPPRG